VERLSALAHKNKTGHLEKFASLNKLLKGCQTNQEIIFDQSINDKKLYILTTGGQDISMLHSLPMASL
jgi:hypothetical protein